MLTGERFRLTRSVRAIDETQSHNIPSGAIIEILLPETENGTVTFLWGRLTLNALAGRVRNPSVGDRLPSAGWR